MSNKAINHTEDQLANSAECAAFQTNLPDYVRRELANEPVAQIYPALTDHIESCSVCEPLYYREFRRQGRQKSLEELVQVGQRSAVAEVMAQILGPTANVTAKSALPAAGSNILAQWREVALSQGRAWIDEATATWRQVELTLSNWGNGLQPAPALVGLMGSEAQDEERGELFALAPEGANFELRIATVPQPENAMLCDLEVTITLYDRFGDYSGVEVTLLHDTDTRYNVTDALGKAYFIAVPHDQLHEMRLVVQLPET